MEGHYLHFNLPNMITIWIMAGIGVAAYGWIRSTMKKSSS